MLSPMKEHWVDIERDFSAPVEQVFGYLAEHENLEKLFGAKVSACATARTASATASALGAS